MKTTKNNVQTEVNENQIMSMITTYSEINTQIAFLIEQIGGDRWDEEDYIDAINSEIIAKEKTKVNLEIQILTAFGFILNNCWTYSNEDQDHIRNSLLNRTNDPNRIYALIKSKAEEFFNRPVHSDRYLLEEGVKKQIPLRKIDISAKRSHSDYDTYLYCLFYSKRIKYEELISGFSKAFEFKEEITIFEETGQPINNCLIDQLPHWSAYLQFRETEEYADIMRKRIIRLLTKKDV